MNLSRLHSLKHFAFASLRRRLVPGLRCAAPGMTKGGWSSALNQLHLQRMPQHPRRAAQGVQRHVGGVRVEDAVQLRPAGDPLRDHGRPGDLLVGHRLLELEGDHASDRAHLTDRP